MTRAEFRSLAQEYVKLSGQPYIAVSDTTNWDKLVNERLELFSFLTLALFDDTVQVNTSTGWLVMPNGKYFLLNESLYEVDGVGYKRRVFLPTQVTVGNVALRNLKGGIGPVSHREMSDLTLSSSSVEAADDSDILCWAYSEPYVLRLFPTPAVGFNGGGLVAGRISGFYLHPALTNNAHEIYLPKHDQRAAAVFTAIGALEPQAGGSSFDRMNRLESGTGDYMAMKVKEARAMIGEMAAPWLLSDEVGK